MHDEPPLTTYIHFLKDGLTLKLRNLNLGERGEYTLPSVRGFGAWLLTLTSVGIVSRLVLLPRPGTPEKTYASGTVSSRCFAAKGRVRCCQVDCEHHSAACRGRSVTLVGAGGWWPDPQLD